MALYKVVLLPSVIKKDLPKLLKSDAQRIMRRIGQLGDDPRPAWSKKLSAREEYRARQGNYRILYIIEDSVKIVTITKVGNRKNIYDQ